MVCFVHFTVLASAAPKPNFSTFNWHVVAQLTLAWFCSQKSDLPLPLSLCFGNTFSKREPLTKELPINTVEFIDAITPGRTEQLHFSLWVHYLKLKYYFPQWIYFCQNLSSVCFLFRMSHGDETYRKL